MPEKATLQLIGLCYNISFHRLTIGYSLDGICIERYLLVNDDPPRPKLLVNMDACSFSIEKRRKKTLIRNGLVRHTFRNKS